MDTLAEDTAAVETLHYMLAVGVLLDHASMSGVSSSLEMFKLLTIHNGMEGVLIGREQN